MVGRMAWVRAGAGISGAVWVAAVVRTEVIGSIRSRFHQVLADALGEDLPDDDLRVDIAPALLFFKLLLDTASEPPDQLALRIASLFQRPGGNSADHTASPRSPTTPVNTKAASS